MSGFQGFGEYAVDFYDGLVADNSKSYWDANKQTYDSDVRDPMKALLTELEPEFGGDFGSPKVFRPHRDVRFAKDKRPYKDHCGGVIEAGRGAGAYYVEVGPDGLRVGGGCFHLESDQLARFRAAVAEEIHGEPFRAILAKLERTGWTIRGDRLRTTPRGVPKDHPRLSLLQYRSVYAVRVWEPDDTLHERGTFTRVRDAWRQLRPFNEWARDHVGLSERAR
ncbi:DUF2461 domain-containing protein [Actinokineospora auranticolor]|uniref:Uncharacterized protein (TIGR02453 family) n=1 Tax=Actinokineospora auranticolor TaxID=155976 RepID=A0A2S6GR34_9PSEU|nr:DUF2461 domain-containing protein [Actinokineospora auranticolor]PPK67633.1 uncharacterized protein (TIGR02453 family) [Actinokineospora auranticolor]